LQYSEFLDLQPLRPRHSEMGLETETKSQDSFTDDESYMQFGFTAIIPCIQPLSDEKQE